MKTRCGRFPGEAKTRCQRPYIADGEPCDPGGEKARCRDPGNSVSEPEPQLRKRFVVIFCERVDVALTAAELPACVRSGRIENSAKVCRKGKKLAACDRGRGTAPAAAAALPTRDGAVSGGNFRPRPRRRKTYCARLLRGKDPLPATPGGRKTRRARPEPAAPAVKNLAACDPGGPRFAVIMASSSLLLAVLVSQVLKQIIKHVCHLHLMF